jgi:hypothetical protein
MLGESVYRIWQRMSAPADYWRRWPDNTFRKMTVFVMVIWLLNLSFIIWGMRPSLITADSAEHYRKMCALVHAPLFILLDLAFVAFGFWMIRRFRNRYVWVCIAFYGMLLGNVLGMIDGWVSCHLLFDR